MATRRAVVFAGIALALGIVASSAAVRRLPDSFFYTRAAEQLIVPGCAEIHCFRVLAPWIVAAMPGPETLRWKAYAVICDAASAFAIFDLCLALGLSRRASFIAGALTVAGFGSFYALFEPYYPDALVFVLTPLVVRWAIEERMVRAAAVAAISVLAKEFVVIALAVVGIADAIGRRWAHAWRVALACASAFAVWLALNAVLRLEFGYSYGPNHSPRLLEGSYLAVWLRSMSFWSGFAAIFNEFGATYLLIPFGLLRAPARLRQIAAAAFPVALLFCYVQQPDRALWNFNFVTSPLIALVLEPLATWFVGTFLAVYVLANLKVGAQIASVPQARYAFAIGLVLAVAAVIPMKALRSA